jgi:hypothetical protein
MTIKEITQLLDNGLSVFTYYIPSEIRLKKRMKSPLREDRDPSFSIYPHHTSGEILFNDFAIGKSGNCYTFVMEMFGLDFKDAVNKIKHDVLGINESDNYNHVPIKKKREYVRIQGSPLVIETVVRGWEQRDLDFFSRFHITQDVLKKYNVSPLLNYTLYKEDNSYTINDSIKSPIYAIKFPSGRVKIYRPLADKRFKWISNINGEEDVFGLSQLPNYCDYLFLMAGNKDVLSFVSIMDDMGLDAIAFNSESASISSAMCNFLCAKSTNIYILYDNDPAGYENAKRLSQQYGFPIRNDLLKPYKVKDFADLAEKLTTEEMAEFKALLCSKL